MTKKLDAELCASYPKIFARRHGSIRESCMPFGFECGDGWFSLIDNLCRFMQNRIDMCAKWKQPVPQVVANQVKEKFGTLRFYHDGGDEVIAGAIDFAGHLSGRMCEFCGETDPRIVGTTRKGWIHTCCYNCYGHARNCDTRWISFHKLAIAAKRRATINSKSKRK